MHEKITECEHSHTQLESHGRRLREQLDSTRAAHAEQNAELRSVVQDSQSALKHLRCEKVCSIALHAHVWQPKYA
jgi:hypothetical protein